MRGLYSHSHEHRTISLRDHCLQISQILEGTHCGANTCRACIRTRANTWKNSWRIIYVLVSCQGVRRAMLLTLDIDGTNIQLHYVINFRSRPGKPNQRKVQNEKFINFAHFCEFWCFSLGKQARFTLNFCSRMPLRKVYEPTFLGLVCRGHSWKLCRNVVWEPNYKYATSTLASSIVLEYVMSLFMLQAHQGKPQNYPQNPVQIPKIMCFPGYREYPDRS